MVVNYDAPHTRETEELEIDSLESPQAVSAEREIDDIDDGEIVEPFELPVADTADEESSTDAAPKGGDEFTCGSCFMVMHRSMIAIDNGGGFPIRQNYVQSLHNRDNSLGKGKPPLPRLWWRWGRRRACNGGEGL